VSGTILGNLVLPNNDGTIYSLSGKVQVGTDAGADVNAPAANSQGILTIEPGVTIFGQSGADFLLVNRGSQLFVNGSATKPVVMTSRSNVVGTATDTSIGQWGGLVILGRAPISDCADSGATGGTNACQAPVEGTSGSVYGGANVNDNSGTIEYLQIRYSGFKVDTNNELNGITLAGVGAGTTFNHVQVYNSSDDGIEWFGGRVNASHLVLMGNDDDSIDTDSGYKGFLQYVIATHRSGGGDHIIEADTSAQTPGVQDNFTPRQHTRISNFTFVSNRSATLVRLRGGTDYTLVNGVMYGQGTGQMCLRIDDATTIQTSGTDEAGAPRFESVYMGCAGGAFQAGTNVTAAQTQAIFEGGSNNISNGTSTLTGIFINGANESARPAFDAASLSSFFVTPTYIGAVKDANDTWWQGWTCGTPSQASCQDIPTPGA
jgi:hypothetical protein